LPIVPRFDRRSRVLSLAAAVLATALGAALTLGLGLVGSRPAAGTCVNSWVAAWGTSAKAVWVPGAEHGPLDGRTMRLLARVQADGDSLRIRLSNRYGFDPLQVDSATVGVAQQDQTSTTPSAELRNGRAVPVTFNGQQETSIPAYNEILSDPVALPVTHGTLVAVSLYLPRPAVMISEHENALQTSFLSVPGDHAADGDGSAFTTTLTSWPVLTGIEVQMTRPTNSLLVLGDSITDGVGTEQDRNQRWTDALLVHLTPTGRPPSTTVINGGIAGNELLSDAPDRTGDSPARRLSWELPAGATDVILEIGNNDIRQGRSAQEIINGMSRFAEEAKARGLRVFLATVTPATPGTPGYGTPAADAVRRDVNDWVRSKGADVADGVIDLAQAVTDPDAPDQLDPRFNADGIHLTAAGSEAMAAAVDPTDLTRPACQ
jgi:lysophospholipase L1-like esterase